MTVFTDDSMLSNMFYFMEHVPDISLIYGRNVNSSCSFAEPSEYCFPIPGLGKRSDLGLTGHQCLQIATWLYTSSEPLWGMYRSEVPKIIPEQYSYGADHAFISMCAYYGGIFGVNRGWKKVGKDLRSRSD